MRGAACRGNRLICFARFQKHLDQVFVKLRHLRMLRNDLLRGADRLAIVSLADQISSHAGHCMRITAQRHRFFDQRVVPERHAGWEFLQDLQLTADFIVFAKAVVDLDQQLVSRPLTGTVFGRQASPTETCG